MSPSIAIHKASTLRLITLSKKRTQESILLQLSNLAKGVKMNYTRIVSTYHEEIGLKGRFNQVMEAAAPALTPASRDLEEFNEYNRGQAF